MSELKKQNTDLLIGDLRQLIDEVRNRVAMTVNAALLANRFADSDGNFK